MTTNTRKTELQSTGWFRRIACIMAGVFVPAILAAAEPVGEMDEVNRWTAAAFGRPLAVADATRPADTDNLRVLTSSHKVLGNVSVWGTPLTLGGRAYVHGLYMDAPAAVRSVCPDPLWSWPRT